MLTSQLSRPLSFLHTRMFPQMMIEVRFDIFHQQSYHQGQQSVIKTQEAGKMITNNYKSQSDSVCVDNSPNSHPDPSLCPHNCALSVVNEKYLSEPPRLIGLE